MGCAVTDWRTCKARGYDAGYISGFMGFVMNTPHWLINFVMNGDRAPKATDPGVYANRTYPMKTTAIQWQKITTRTSSGLSQVVAYFDVPFDAYYANYTGSPNFSIKAEDEEGAIYEQEVPVSPDLPDSPKRWEKMIEESLALKGKLTSGGILLVDEAHGNAEYTLSNEIPLTNVRKDLPDTDDAAIIANYQTYLDAVHADGQLRGFLRVYFNMDTNNVEPEALPPASPESGYRVNSYVTFTLQP
jgi:hypothetical protein